MNFASCEALYVLIGYIDEQGIVPTSRTFENEVCYKEHLTFEVAEGFAVEFHYTKFHFEDNFEEYGDIGISFPCLKEKKYYFQKLSDHLYIQLGRVRNVNKKFKDYSIWQDQVFRFFSYYVRRDCADNETEQTE